VQIFRLRTTYKTKSNLSDFFSSLLVLIRHGLSNKEIAQARGRSVATVKNQVSVCLEKLGVDSRTRLMALFMRPDRVKPISAMWEHAAESV